MNYEDALSQESFPCPECGDEHSCERGLRIHYGREHSPLRDREFLYDLYHGQGLTAEEAADVCGCSKWTIYRWLDRHGIEKRSGGRRPIEDLHDSDHLETLYVVEGLSTTEIAERYECHSSTVSRWLERHGIDSRGFGDTAPPELQDEDSLRDLYITEGLSSGEIADRLGCGDTTVCTWLNKHDIPIRGKGLPGEKKADQPRR